MEDEGAREIGRLAIWRRWWLGFRAFSEQKVKKTYNSTRSAVISKKRCFCRSYWPHGIQAGKRSIYRFVFPPTHRRCHFSISTDIARYINDFYRKQLMCDPLANSVRCIVRHFVSNVVIHENCRVVFSAIFSFAMPSFRFTKDNAIQFEAAYWIYLICHPVHLRSIWVIEWPVETENG